MTHLDPPRAAGLGVGRRSLLLPAAAIAVIGAMTALTQVFVRQSWFGASLMAVGVAFGAGWVARRLDVPGVLSPAVSLLALVAFLGIAFHGSTTAAGFPTAGTMRAIGESFSLAMRDIRDLAAPAEPTAALRLLATTGVFVVAMLVDIMVFRLRRPVAAGMPLLALFLVPTSMTTHANAFAFVLAALGYLTLLVAEGRDRARSWGRRLTGIDVLDDVADVSHVARVGRRIGTAAVGLALCVPLALPSVGNGIVGGGGSGGWFGAGGGSNTVTVINPIVEIQRRLRDNPRREVFTYRADRDPDYLRLTTLDQFDGRQWVLVRQKADSGKRVGKSHPIPAPKELAGIATLQARYEIEVSDLDVRWLPLPYAPSVVDVSGDWRYEPSGLAVFSTRKTSRNVSFTVQANRPDPTIDQLRAGGRIPDSIKAAFLGVPGQTPPLATKVLNEATAGKDNPYDKAVALQHYFRTTGGFHYDVNAPAGTSSDALTSFLETRTGYCEQFAATMAYLARLAHIPARVVVGFTKGTPLVDGSFLVTNNDAHAWPELYFPKAGWTRFEPTPRQGVETPAYSVTAGAGGVPTVDVPNDTPTVSPTQAPGTTNPNKGRDEANNDLDNPTALPVPTVASKPFRVPVLPLALALLVAALVAPSAVAFGTRQRRRATASGDAAKVHAAWAALADAAEDAGLALRAADSPRAAARRLVAEAPLTGTAAAAVVALGGAEERARYAPVAPAAHEAAGLDASVRTVRRALLKAQPRWTRARATVFPPSAVRRLRSSATRSSAAVERTRAGAVSRLAGLFRRGRPRAA